MDESLPTVSKERIMELKSQYEMFRELQQKVLEKDVDYGYPAGRRSGKPTLYKSGAEKLTRLFNLIPVFEVTRQVETDDFICYVFRCLLKTASGAVVGEGYGAANSREKPHWTQNPWAHQNSILKIAKKRAHVDAVLTGLGASNVFTQDLEDFEPEHPQAPASGSEAQPEPSSQPQQASQTKQTRAATEKQLKLIAALLRDAAEAMQKSADELKQELKTFFGVEHLNQLSTQQASEAIDMLKNMIAAQETIEQENNDMPPF